MTYYIEYQLNKLILAFYLTQYKFIRQTLIIS